MPDPFVDKRPDTLSEFVHSKTLLEMKDSLFKEIDSIAWHDFNTAYSSAVSVSFDLKLLLLGDEQQAVDASHRLWSGLCHQHAYLSSAAEPALKFLLLALNESSNRLKIEILDILLGFANCYEAEIEFTVRINEYLNSERPLFIELSSYADEEISDFSKCICENLDAIQNGTFAKA